MFVTLLSLRMHRNQLRSRHVLPWNDRVHWQLWLDSHHSWPGPHRELTLSPPQAFSLWAPEDRQKDLARLGDQTDDDPPITKKA